MSEALQWKIQALTVERNGLQVVDDLRLAISTGAAAAARVETWGKHAEQREGARTPGSCGPWPLYSLQRHPAARPWLAGAQMLRAPPLSEAPTREEVKDNVGEKKDVGQDDKDPRAPRLRLAEARRVAGCGVAEVVAAGRCGGEGRGSWEAAAQFNTAASLLVQEAGSKLLP